MGDLVNKYPMRGGFNASPIPITAVYASAYKNCHLQYVAWVSLSSSLVQSTRPSCSSSWPGDEDADVTSELRMRVLALFRNFTRIMSIFYVLVL